MIMGKTSSRLAISVTAAVSAIFMVSSIVSADPEKYCGNCGNPLEQTEYQPAGCSTDGYIVYTCMNCFNTETDYLGAYGHTYGDWSFIKEANCQESGEMIRYCVDCSNTDFMTVPADPNNHTFTEWEIITPASCVNPGEMGHHCIYCLTEETTIIGLSDDHNMLWDIDVEPTCTEDGVEQGVCTDCGKVESEIIPSLGHDFGEWKVEKEATCKEEGLKIAKCSRCEKEVEEKIPKKDHEMGEWYWIYEPTCITMGMKERDCVASEDCEEFELKEEYPEGMIFKGTKDDDVKNLQEALQALGFECGGTDGEYGDKTELAIKAYEKKLGIHEDGTAWPGVRMLAQSHKESELKMTAKVTSEQKEVFTAGNHLTVKFELNNTGKVHLKNVQIEMVALQDGKLLTLGEAPLVDQHVYGLPYELKTGEKAETTFEYYVPEQDTKQGKTDLVAIAYGLSEKDEVTVFSQQIVLDVQ